VGIVFLMSDKEKIWNTVDKTGDAGHQQRGELQNIHSDYRLNLKNYLKVSTCSYCAKRKRKADSPND